jgi:hypothetical protein
MNQNFLSQFNQIPDEQLIQIYMMNPLLFKGLCLYLSIELQAEKEKNLKKTKHGKKHSIRVGH